MKTVKVLPLAVAAQQALEGCEGALAAANELMTEFVSKKRAADWGIINDGLVAAERGRLAMRAALDAARERTP